MKDHASQFVKVYDFDTETFTTIPLSELAPGMVQATVNGGICWINPRATGKIKQSPHRHPPFNKKTRGQMRRLAAVFKDVYIISAREWEDGFRRDMNPDQEITRWLHMADIFEDTTRRFTLDLTQKKALFQLLLVCSTTDYGKISQVTTPEGLGDAIMRETIQAYYGQPELKIEAAMKAACEYPDPNGKIPRPVESLRNPSERELLKVADVVFGIDSSTGDYSIFYGRQLLKQIATGGEVRELPSISYLYDSRTDQLELLVAAVQLVKGSCDYPRNDTKP